MDSLKTNDFLSTENSVDFDNINTFYNTNLNNTNNDSNLNTDNISINSENKNTLEIPLETPSESVEIPIEEANTTNCLALTIQKDHKLVAVKNVFLRSIKMSWKVIVSTITLTILKLLT